MVEVLEGVVVDIVESEDTVEDHQVAEVDIVVDHHLQVLEVVATKEAHRLDHLEVEDMVEDQVRVEKVDTKEVVVVAQNEGIVVVHHLQVLEVVATKEAHRLDHLEVEDTVEDQVRVEKVDTKEVEGVVQGGVIKKMHLHHDQLHEDIATIEIAMDDHQVSNKKEAKASFFVIVRGIY